jgi:putative Mg2+ transporter-C (MgtC) family protein
VESIAFMGGVVSIVFRLGAATLIGCVLGINRDLRGKPAGLRTHALVALGSALVTVTAIQLAYSGGVVDGGAVLRAVQGIIAGVGFLGGGVILRGGGDEGTTGRVPGVPPTRAGGHHRKEVRGLTTAASVWVAACLGIACGAGQWPSAIIALVLTLFVLVAGGPIEGAVHRRLHVHADEDASPPPSPPPPDRTAKL